MFKTVRLSAPNFMYIHLSDYIYAYLCVNKMTKYFCKQQQSFTSENCKSVGGSERNQLVKASALNDTRLPSHTLPCAQVFL